MTNAPESPEEMPGYIDEDRLCADCGREKPHCGCCDCDRCTGADSYDDTGYTDICDPYYDGL